MELTNEHIEILKHTEKAGFFCGDSPEMRDLCKVKLMESAGRKSFVPDEYFKLMKDGKSVLDDLRELGETWLNITWKSDATTEPEECANAGTV